MTFRETQINKLEPFMRRVVIYNVYSYIGATRARLCTREMVNQKIEKIHTWPTTIAHNDRFFFLHLTFADVFY